MGSFASAIFLPVTRDGVPSYALCPMLSACAKLYWPHKTTPMKAHKYRKWVSEVATGLRDFLPIPVLGAYIAWGLKAGAGLAQPGVRARLWHESGSFEVCAGTLQALSDRYGISVEDIMLQDCAIRSYVGRMAVGQCDPIEDAWMHWPTVMAVDGRQLKSGAGAPTCEDVVAQ